MALGRSHDWNDFSLSLAICQRSPPHRWDQTYCRSLRPTISDIWRQRCYDHLNPLSPFNIPPPTDLTPTCPCAQPTWFASTFSNLYLTSPSSPSSHHLIYSNSEYNAAIWQPINTSPAAVLLCSFHTRTAPAPSVPSPLTP